MGISILQPSFASGELSPSLYARVDLARYQTGLKTCKNFWIMPYGGARNRPGTVFIGEIHDSSIAGRLIPFKFNNEQTYVLEFGDKVMRVIYRGGYVLEWTTEDKDFVVNGDFATDLSNWTKMDYQSAVVWTSDGVRFLNISTLTIGKIGQTLAGLIPGEEYVVKVDMTWSGAVAVPTAKVLVGLAPGSSETASLTITTKGESTFAFVATAQTHHVSVYGKSRPVSGDPYLKSISVTGPEITGVSDIPYEIETPFAYQELADIRFVQSADVMTLVHPNHKPQELRRQGHADWEMDDIDLLPKIEPPATVTAEGFGSEAPVREVTYQVTAVIDDGSVIDESLSTTSNQIEVRGPSYRGELSWDAVDGATYYNVYKDNTGSGVFGFAGRSTTTEFIDYNILPNSTDTPPNGNDPFDSEGNYPSAVSYYQQRLVFGGTINKPQTTWFSKVGLFRNFGYATPMKDDDSITFTQASLEVERVMHYLPLRQLLVMTSGTEVEMGGGASGLTPRTIKADPQSYNGIGRVRPLVIDNTVLFVQASGNKVLSLSYQLQDDGFAGADMTVLSSHLFRGVTVTDWAYQKAPDTTVWCVRSDGKLLGLTFLREQEVAAWHWHETDGAFESICAIPEGNEYGVYAIVRRTIGEQTKRYVERFASREMVRNADGLVIQEQGYFVDCGLTYDGWNILDTTMTLSGGDTWLNPEVLQLDASLAVFSETDVGNHIVFRLQPSEGQEGRLRCQIIEFTSATSVSVIPLGPVPESLRDTPSSAWGKAVHKLLGLEHLEGKEVAILSDGNVEPRQTVTDGQITLQDPGTIVHVGLPYESELETLAINISGEETLMDKAKIIPSVTAIVDESRGILAGTSRKDLFELKPRGDEDYDQPVELKTGVVKINTASNWSGDGRVIIRQEDPLPLTVLGIIPELVTGGKK
jgi:hypothetical protein